MTYPVKSSDHKITAKVSVWREGLKTVQGVNVESIFEYSDSFFGDLGLKAVTRRAEAAWNGGEVIYMGAGIEPEALLPTVARSLKARTLPYVAPSTDPEVEHILRDGVGGKQYLIRINYKGMEVQDGDDLLKPYEVRVEAAQVASRFKNE